MVTRAGGACARRRRAHLSHLARAAAARGARRGQRSCVEPRPHTLRLGPRSLRAPPRRRCVAQRAGRRARRRARRRRAVEAPPDGAAGRAASGAAPRERRAQPRVPDEPAQRRPAARRAQPGPLGNPKLTFDQFVIGDCNRLAHAAALTVARDAGAGLQPAVHLRPPGRRQDAPAAARSRPCCSPTAPA